MEISFIEQQRGKSLNLYFGILLNSGEVTSGTFNIEDMAEARFKFNCFRSRTARSCTSSLSLKKHASAKDSTIRLDVKCEKLIYSQQFICTEQWIEWQQIGEEVNTPKDLCNISVSMTVIPEKSLTFAKMYEDTDLTDFTLSAIDGTVPVHRAFLAAHSDVFKSMLSREWKETAEGRVELKGVTQQTLQHLKQYIYLGTLPDDGLRPLLEIAMCYMIDDLKAACISKLARTVTPDHLEDLLTFASDNKLLDLILAILQLAPANVVHEAYKINKKKQISEPVDKTK